MQLLVDFSSLLYRAYHSTPDTVAWHGVHGVFGMLARLLIDRRPDRLGVATDDDWRPAFRVEALPMYKAQRVSEEPDPVGPHDLLGQQILRAMGVAVIGVPGFEAEDVIATLAERATEMVEIVSGDRDLFALVRDPDRHVLYPKKGVTEMWDVTESEITARYGIPGRAYGDFALLRGDPSDGLPGVPGIGEKTAAQLMARYGSLAGLLAADDVPPLVAKRLAAAADYLIAARRVVLPVPDIPLPPVSIEIPTEPADAAEVERLATEHGVENAVSRLAAALYAR